MFNIFKKEKPKDPFEIEKERMAKIPPYNPFNYPSKYTHYKNYKGDNKLRVLLPWREVLRLAKEQREQVVKLTHYGKNI